MNTFAVVAQLPILSCYFAGIIITGNMFPYSPWLLGTALAAVTVFIMVTAGFLLYSRGSSALEAELQMLEHERREVEIKVSLEEMHADIARLTKHVPIQSIDPLSPLGRRSTISLASPDLEHAIPKSRQALETSLNNKEANAQKARYDIGLYPCYVIALSDLCELDEICCHEDLLKKKKLKILSPRSRRPSCAFTYFISHNWDQDDFPDNPCNTKLRWLKQLRSHLNLKDDSEVWLWWDYISIPQKNRERQILAISSIVYYVHLCSRFLPLVRDEDEWRALYKNGIAKASDNSNSNGMFPGTLNRYLRKYMSNQMSCAFWIIIV